jgi:glycosyltransferase involved in cell wall biosynthesis
MKLSVVVTTYNRSGDLDRTLESIAAQTRIPDELIISDDCSTDDTAKIISKWKERFPLLKYNRNDRNLNMPGNLNIAISMAQGEYIANLHDADTFDPTLLEKWELALDTYQTAGFVFSGIGGWQIPSEAVDGIILHNVQPFTLGRLFFESHFLHKFSSIVWGTVMARRSAYSQLLPFDNKYGFISDVDMWMRMCLKFDVAYVREPLIILDNSPTPHRAFNWERLGTIRLMQETNIFRFYGDQPARFQREMSRHRNVVRRVYFRRLLGRIWHRDWPSVYEYLRLW